MKMKAVTFFLLVSAALPAAAVADCNTILSPCTQDCLNLPPTDFAKKMTCMSECREKVSECREDERNETNSTRTRSYERDRTYTPPQKTTPRSYTRTPQYRDPAPSRTIENPMDENGRNCVSSRTLPTESHGSGVGYDYKNYNWELTNRCNAFAKVKFRWLDTGLEGQKAISPGGTTKMSCSTAGKKRTCREGFNYSWSINR